MLNLLRVDFKGERGSDCGGLRRDCFTTLLRKCHEMIATTLSAFAEKEREEEVQIEEVQIEEGLENGDEEDESLSKTNLIERLKTIGCICGNRHIFSTIQIT